MDDRKNSLERPSQYYNIPNENDGKRDYHITMRALL